MGGGRPTKQAKPPDQHIPAGMASSRRGVPTRHELPSGWARETELLLWTWPPQLPLSGKTYLHLRCLAFGAWVREVLFAQTPDRATALLGSQQGGLRVCTAGGLGNLHNGEPMQWLMRARKGPKQGEGELDATTLALSYYVLSWQQSSNNWGIRQVTEDVGAKLREEAVVLLHPLFRAAAAVVCLWCRGVPCPCLPLRLHEAAGVSLWWCLVFARPSTFGAGAGRLWGPGFWGGFVFTANCAVSLGWPEELCSGWLGIEGKGFLAVVRRAVWCWVLLWVWWLRCLPLRVLLFLPGPLVPLGPVLEWMCLSLGGGRGGMSSRAMAWSSSE